MATWRRHLTLCVAEGPGGGIVSPPLNKLPTFRAGRRALFAAAPAAAAQVARPLGRGQLGWVGLIAKTGTNPTKLGLVVDKTTQWTNTEPGSGGIARSGPVGCLRDGSRCPIGSANSGNVEMFQSRASPTTLERRS